MARKRNGKREYHRGEGSVYRRKDGRWVASLRLDGGRVDTYHPNKEAASAHLTDWRTRTAERAARPAAKATLSEYLDQWLVGSRSESWEPGTAATYDWAVGIWKSVLGDARLHAIGPAEIDSALLELRDRRKLAVGTRDLARSVLSVALRDAVRATIIERNPVALSMAPRAARGTKGTKRTGWTSDQARRFLEANTTDRLSALWLFLLTTGARQGEARGLRWSDIDQERGVVELRQKLSKDGRVASAPKDHEPRQLPLSTALADALRRHRARQWAERAQQPGVQPDSVYVFCQPNGRPYSDPTLRRAFYRACDTAGLERVPPHTCRHTAASLLGALGHSPKVAQELLGHASIAVTADIYTHVASPQLKGAIEDLGRLLAR